MRKNPALFVASVTAFLAVAVFAACASRPAPPPANQGIHGFISRVESGGNVAYIFGSMHLGRSEWFPLSPVVENAMARADVFAFEADMALMALPEVSQHMGRLMSLPYGMTLEDVLPPDVFESFVASMEALPNVTYEMIATLTPLGASMVIAIIELMPLMGIYSEYSVDDYVHRFATARGKPVIGLNDVFREIDLVLGVPMDVQLTMFETPAEWEEVDWAADWETAVQGVVDMGLVEAYEAGNIAMFQSAMGTAPDDTASLFEKHMHHVMWHVRCHIFADEIARLLLETEEPTTFFVTIGAGHIAGGDFGKVFSLLEEMGFEVEPLWN